MVTFHSPSAPLLRRRTSSGPQVLLNASWLLMTSIKQKKTAVGFFLGGVFSFHCNLFHFGGEENLQKNGFIIVHCQVLQNVPPLGAETLMFSLLRQAVSVWFSQMSSPTFCSPTPPGHGRRLAIVTYVKGMTAGGVRGITVRCVWKFMWGHIPRWYFFPRTSAWRFSALMLVCACCLCVIMLWGSLLSWGTEVWQGQEVKGALIFWSHWSFPRDEKNKRSSGPATGWLASHYASTCNNISDSGSLIWSVDVISTVFLHFDISELKLLYVVKTSRIKCFCCF